MESPKSFKPSDMAKSINVEEFTEQMELNSIDTFTTLFEDLVVIQACLNSLKGMKLAPNWPQPLALAAKITPKWPKMAQNGHKRPPQVLYGYTLA